VIEALTRTGSGRLEIIREAYQEDIFHDLRLVNPLISALDNNYPEIADLVSRILEEWGEAMIPVLKADINFQGGKGQSRKVDLISKISGREEKEFYLEAIEKGSVEVKSSAVRALKDLPECEDVLLELSKDKKKEIREASLLSLADLGSEAAVKRLVEVFNSKERSIAVYPVKVSKARTISQMLLEEGEKLLEIILKSEKGVSLPG